MERLDAAGQMIDDLISRSFALSEFVESCTATRLCIDNTPPQAVDATLRSVLIPSMQRIRDVLGFPVVVKSGYRCRALNAVVHGSPVSQHLTGNACDFVAPAFGSPRSICYRLQPLVRDLGIDQLIQEGGWVHVSFTEHPRGQVMTAHFLPSGVTYTTGLA